MLSPPLYLDFSRKQGEWVANRFGGRENLEAIDFIRRFNSVVHELYPNALTIAEESTAWPSVTRPVEEGGLGFDYKWNMGWMHDTLQYFANDPVYRAYHHGTLTFSLLYAFSERASSSPFPMMKSSISSGACWTKCPVLTSGREVRQSATALHMWSHPGRKLLFMGGEFGQWQEWSEARALDWFLLDEDPQHAQLKDMVQELNRLLATERPLYEDDYSWDGFQWLDLHDYERSILAYIRKSPSTGESIQTVLNFTPVVRHGYRLGVPEPGIYEELFTSDDEKYGGSGIVNTPRPSMDIPAHGQPHSIEMMLPPLGAVYLKKQNDT
ncbi:MAG: alpha amylase C-terminal domain-containing protein [Chloroflexota bacterium]